MQSVACSRQKCDNLLEELERVLEASRRAQQDVPLSAERKREPTISSVPAPPAPEPRANRSPSQSQGARTPPPPPRPPPPPPPFAHGVLRHSPPAQKPQSSRASSPPRNATTAQSAPPVNSNAPGSPAPKKPPPPPPSPPPPPLPVFSFTTPIKQVRKKPPPQTLTPEPPTPPTPHQQHQQPLLSNGNSSSSSGSTAKKAPPPPPRPPPPPPPLATPSPVRLKVKAGGPPKPASSVQGIGGSTSEEHLKQQQQQQQQQNGPSKPASSPSPLKSPATPGASSGSEFRVLHWEALPANQATVAYESVWNNPLVDVLDIKPISKLELFMKAQAPTPVVRIRSAIDGRQQLLDSATSNNLLIQFQNTTPQALAAALERMDRNVLTGAYVQQCLSVLSKEATVVAVLNWTQSPGNDISKLGPAEMFVHVLASAPDAQLRLEVLRLSHSFQEDVPRKMADAQRMQTACDRLMSCRAWRRLLHHLLAVGNTINAHRNPRPAPGFKLSSLGKFADMRSQDKKLSLLDAVIEALELDESRHIDDLIELEPLLSNAKEVDLKSLCQEAAELQSRDKGIGKVSSLLELFDKERARLEALQSSQPQQSSQQSQQLNQKPETSQLQSEPQPHPSQTQSSGPNSTQAPGSAPFPADSSVAEQLATIVELSAFWRDTLRHWQAEAASLRAAVADSCRSIRDVAAWHCEPMRPQWEMQNARAWLDNLHRFLLQVRQSVHKTRSSLAHFERMLQKQTSAPATRSQPTPPTNPSALTTPTPLENPPSSPHTPATPAAPPPSPSPFSDAVQSPVGTSIPGTPTAPPHSPFSLPAAPPPAHAPVVEPFPGSKSAPASASQIPSAASATDLQQQQQQQVGRRRGLHSFPIDINAAESQEQQQPQQEKMCDERQLQQQQQQQQQEVPHLLLSDSNAAGSQEQQQQVKICSELQQQEQQQQEQQQQGLHLLPSDSNAAGSQEQQQQQQQQKTCCQEQQQQQQQQQETCCQEQQQQQQQQLQQQQYSQCAQVAPPAHGDASSSAAQGDNEHASAVRRTSCAEGTRVAAMAPLKEEPAVAGTVQEMDGHHQMQQEQEQQQQMKQQQQEALGWLQQQQQQQLQQHLQEQQEQSGGKEQDVVQMKAEATREGQQQRARKGDVQRDSDLQQQQQQQREQLEQLAGNEQDMVQTRAEATCEGQQLRKGDGQHQSDLQKESGEQAVCGKHTSAEPEAQQVKMQGLCQQQEQDLHESTTPSKVHRQIQDCSPCSSNNSDNGSSDSSDDSVFCTPLPPSLHKQLQRVVSPNSPLYANGPASLTSSPIPSFQLASSTSSSPNPAHRAHAEESVANKDAAPAVTSPAPAVKRLSLSRRSSSFASRLQNGHRRSSSSSSSAQQMHTLSLSPAQGPACTSRTPASNGYVQQASDLWYPLPSVGIQSQCSDNALVEQTRAQVVSSTESAQMLPTPPFPSLVLWPPGESDSAKSTRSSPSLSRQHSTNIQHHPTNTQASNKAHPRQQTSQYPTNTSLTNPSPRLSRIRCLSHSSHFNHQSTHTPSKPSGIPSPHIPRTASCPALDYQPPTSNRQASRRARTSLIPSLFSPPKPPGTHTLPSAALNPGSPTLTQEQHDLNLAPPTTAQGQHVLTPPPVKEQHALDHEQASAHSSPSEFSLPLPPGPQQGGTPGRQQGGTPCKQEGGTPGKQQGVTPGQQQDATLGRQQGDTPGQQQKGTPGRQQGDTPGQQQGGTPRRASMRRPSQEYDSSQPQAGAHLVPPGHSQGHSSNSQLHTGAQSLEAQQQSSCCTHATPSAQPLLGSPGSWGSAAGGTGEALVQHAEDVLVQHAKEMSAQHVGDAHMQHGDGDFKQHAGQGTEDGLGCKGTPIASMGQKGCAVQAAQSAGIHHNGSSDGLGDTTRESECRDQGKSCVEQHQQESCHRFEEPSKPEISHQHHDNHDSNVHHCQQQQQQQQQQQGQGAQSSRCSDAKQQQQCHAGLAACLQGQACKSRLLVMELQELLCLTVPSMGGAIDPNRQSQLEGCGSGQLLLLAVTRLGFQPALQSLKEAECQVGGTMVWPAALITSAGTQIWLRHQHSSVPHALNTTTHHQNGRQLAGGSHGGEPLGGGLAANAAGAAGAAGTQAGHTSAACVEQHQQQQQQLQQWVLLQEWEHHYTKQTCYSTSSTAAWRGPEYNDAVQQAMLATASALLKPQQSSAPSASPTKLGGQSTGNGTSTSAAAGRHAGPAPAAQQHGVAAASVLLEPRQSSADPLPTLHAGQPTGNGTSTATSTAGIQTEAEGIDRAEDVDLLKRDAQLCASEPEGDGAATMPPSFGCNIMCGAETGSAHLVSARVRGSHSFMTSFVAQLQKELHATCQQQGLQVKLSVSGPVPPRECSPPSAHTAAGEQHSALSPLSNGTSDGQHAPRQQGPAHQKFDCPSNQQSCLIHNPMLDAAVLQGCLNASDFSCSSPPVTEGTPLSGRTKANADAANKFACDVVMPDQQQRRAGCIESQLKDHKHVGCNVSQVDCLESAQQQNPEETCWYVDCTPAAATSAAATAFIADLLGFR